MTHEQAVQLYKRNPRAAIAAWDAEFQRREAAYTAANGVAADDGPVSRAFWSWRQLECQLCGGGPDRCKPGCDALDARH